MRFVVFVSLFFIGFVSRAQVVQLIEIVGNKKTQERIVLRELTFAQGDTLMASELENHQENSKNNLFNTTLFNFTSVELKDSLGVLFAKVTLQERWYLWPEVIVKFQERNFAEWWKNKYLSRIDLGLHINQYNFRGLNQTLSANGNIGFTERVGFQYNVPYLNKKMTNGFKFAANYGTQNEVFVGIEKNEMQFLKNDSNPIYSRFNVQFEYFIRKGFYQTQFFNAEWVQQRASDSLTSYSNEFFGNRESFLRYAFLSYRYRFDKRFSQNYPLRGYFFDFKFDQFGLGDLDQSGLSVTRLNSSYRYYKKLFPKQYWAVGAFTNVYLTDNVPFNFQSGLGFENYVRGYESYVLFGNVSFLVKNNYKVELLKPRNFTLPFIKRFKKFSKTYLGVYWNNYIDVGYVNNNNPMGNNLTNKLLVGLGTGLDWITYYDLVIRTEYSANQLGEFRFNISFTAPI